MNKKKCFLDSFLLTNKIIGNYGEKGFEELERLKDNNICIAYSEKVKSLAEPVEFDKILASIW